MSMPADLADLIKKAVKKLYDLEIEEVRLETPARLEYGDCSSSVAFDLSKALSRPPVEIAEKLVKELSQKKLFWLGRVEAVNGFVNFFLSQKYLWKNTLAIAGDSGIWSTPASLLGQKIMVEYAHPNTHKEMHIGHLRTLLIGESLARIFKAAGAQVFRANYQGDIGPHVAKAIFGVQKLLSEKNLSLEDVDKQPATQKAHFLGQGYVRGVEEYGNHKKEIDELNKKIYIHNSQIEPIYRRTRQWSLDYFEEIYHRLGTRFDRLFFESEVADNGKKIVEENLDKVFERSGGAVVFPGEKFGLHRRVFVTSDGNPTYEAKDMDLFLKEYEAFPFDRCIHVVANEQRGYFSVVFEVVRQLIQQDKRFQDLLKEHQQKAEEVHLAMGMVNLVGQKMSSRTGVLVTIEELLDKVKSSVEELIKGRSLAVDSEEAEELIAQAAVKYAYLRVDPKKDLAFDIRSSVNLEGDSGPYLQYTYARIFSLLQKAQNLGFEKEKEFTKFQGNKENEDFFVDEPIQLILGLLSKSNEAFSEAAERLNPAVLTSYLFGLAQAFNNFYNQIPILANRKNLEKFDLTVVSKLLLVEATGKVLKQGLGLLGITVLERM